MNRRANRVLSLALGAVVGGLLYRLARRPEDLAGQVVLITGGSRGLGLALAIELARHGCRLALAARDEDRLRYVCSDPRFQPSDVAAFPCDVRDRAQIKATIAGVVERFGRIDVLINNAGAVQVGAAADLTLEDFQEAMNVMFWGPLHAIEETLDHFRRQGGGRIVNIASIGGKVSVPHLLPYCCAKFALVGLSEGLHAELARENIHVMTVSPGLMRTGGHLNAQFRGHQDREFAWFGLSANTPLLSMRAEDAAAQIVDGLRRRKSDLTLSTQARWFARAHGLSPSAVADALSVASRFLPAAANGSQAKLPGRAILDASKGLSHRLIVHAGRQPVAKYQ